MGVRQKKLIIMDGMPGSGKTTSALRVAEQLSAWNISNRCIVELEAEHPLFIYGYSFDSLVEEEQAELFITLLLEKYRAFVQERLEHEDEVTIIESVMLQDTINSAHHMGMNSDKLRHFAVSLAKILAPLNPVLIYFYQMDVEAHWRFICSVRGNEWGPVSLHTDDDFREAGELWSSSQTFVRTTIDAWDIPKLVIENRDYRWDEYSNDITAFVEANVRDSRQ
ncbi:hypothetical protein [Paenibacillus sp. ACRRY]|uniref:hypothetical protein n=1 Tax=Paenibacillus sp. ACRRY TaxID=2918208 RepID=UPI001EF58004|nr:hypothetical protein [Paenibacillus sp. ACRRY]MCG7386728.1 hypothetical protein [Paenibacillus sp. ACRRY]